MTMYMPQSNGSNPQFNDYFPPAQACSPDYSIAISENNNNINNINNINNNNISNNNINININTINDTTNYLPTPLNSNSDEKSIPQSLISNEYSNSSIKTHFTLIRKQNLLSNNNNTSDSNNNNLKKIILNLKNASLNEICRKDWTKFESQQERRIIRFTKFLKSNILTINTSIQSLDTSGIIPQLGICNKSGLEYLEISCLRYKYQINKDSQINYKYYITSVEIIKLIEFLIGSYDSENSEVLRKERCRFRSNLVPFWAKWTVGSKISIDKERNELIDKNDKIKIKNDINFINKIEFGNRIMSYVHRKPRGFDKDVRVLNWENLGQALQRVLQNYYCKI